MSRQYDSKLLAHASIQIANRTVRTLLDTGLDIDKVCDVLAHLEDAEQAMSEVD